MSDFIQNIIQLYTWDVIISRWWHQDDKSSLKGKKCLKLIYKSGCLDENYRTVFFFFFLRIVILVLVKEKKVHNVVHADKRKILLNYFIYISSLNYLLVIIVLTCRFTLLLYSKDSLVSSICRFRDGWVAISILICPLVC